jgi:hypothetical protein
MSVLVKTHPIDIFFAHRTFPKSGIIILKQETMQIEGLHMSTVFTPHWGFDLISSDRILGRKNILKAGILIHFGVFLLTFYESK